MQRKKTQKPNQTKAKPEFFQNKDVGMAGFVSDKGRELIVLSRAGFVYTVKWVGNLSLGYKQTSLWPLEVSEVDVLGRVVFSSCYWQ